jgi:mannan endo-1,4-beta-mannosidase
MWKRWDHHPYNAANGGPCGQRQSFLTCPNVRAAIKRRLAFVIERWGGSGALFAWDLWNEIHPAYAQNDAGHFDEFIRDVATFVRERERALHGRAHPITVSAFGPMLTDTFRSKELGETAPDPRAIDAIFRHRELDVATVHTYAHGTIDDPKNTVAPAIAMGRLTRESLAAIHDDRPFFDSEHGPIHTFKDKRRVLPEVFDDEYFRHLQWAHLASGGAGGGMRWPNRRPHVLTRGMHRAQWGLAAYLKLIDWAQFRRRNLNEEIRVAPGGFAAFGCGDDGQAVVWVVRRKPLAPDGTLARQADPKLVTIAVPGLADGTYRVATFHTERGVIESELAATSTAGVLRVNVPVARDLALAIRRQQAGIDLASPSV